MKSENTGLVRPNMEKFLFEELSFDNVKDSHRVLFNVVINKLKNKAHTPALISKAIQNEQKIVFKYRDIEDKVIRGLGCEVVMRRINETDVMKIVNAQASKLREVKKEKTKTGAKTTDTQKLSLSK